MKWAARILGFAATLVLTLLAAGFFGALLVRSGPGFDSDERDLDPRFSAAAHQAIREERASEASIVLYYSRFLTRAVHGDLGLSHSLNLPVSELIAGRASITLHLIGAGFAIAWLAGLSLAAAAVLVRSPLLAALSECAGGLFLSLPAAVLALLLFLARGPVSLALGLTLFPQVFRYARDLFERALSAPAVLAARARGVPESRIVLRYIALPCWAPLAAFAAVLVTSAFGAAIPIEAVCDLPGLGQLAWKAAVARDLPVLVALTLLVTAVTLTANALADLALARVRS